MRNIVFILTFFFFSVTTQAQLKNTKWKGVVHSDNIINVEFDFGTDTLEVINSDDGTSLETLSYTATDTLLTIKKLFGQSGCDPAAPGEYKYEIKEDALFMTLVSDPCVDRSTHLDKSKWTKTN